MKINPEKHYKFILPAIFFVLMAAVFQAFFTDLSFPESDYNFKTGGKTKLRPNASVTQVFTAEKNNLNQVKIALRNTSVRLREKILLQLADESCGDILRQDEVGFFTTVSGIAHKFNFPEIADSQGKKYCFKATYLSETRTKGDYPEILISREAQFSDRAYTNAGKGDEFQGRTLIIRPAYGNDTFFADLKELNERMSQYKPGFFKASSLVFLFLIFFATAIVVVMLLVLF